MVHQPSALDSATVVWLPGGDRQYQYPASPEDAERQQQDAAHRAAWDAKLEQDEHDRLVAERVAAYLKAGPGNPEPADSFLKPGRAALVGCLRWLDRAKVQAGEARERVEVVAAAVARRDTAMAASARLEAEVGQAFSEWVRFGSTGDRPDSRIAERERLRTELAEAEPLAVLIADAIFERDVGNAIVQALVAKLPERQADVAVEESSPISERIQTLATALSAEYSKLAALREATGRRDLPRSEKVTLQRLPTGPVEIAIEAAPEAVDAWRTVLAGLAGDPHALVPLPDTAPPPGPPTRLAGLCRQLLGKQP